MATRNQFFTTAKAGQVETRTVEVAPKPAVAKVVREGFQVPVAKLDAVQVERFLGTLDIVQPRQTPRIVSQSIAPGVRVTAGTVVDLVLASVDDVPFGIFEGVHKDLRERNVATLLDGMLAQTATRQTLLKFDKAEDVPQADRAALTTQFQGANVAIDEADPNANFESAFNAARIALAFR